MSSSSGVKPRTLTFTASAGANNNNYKNPNAKPVQRIYILKEDVKRFIGYSGMNVRRLVHESGVKNVKVLEDKEREDGTVPVVIEGNPFRVAKAVEMIEQMYLNNNDEEEAEGAANYAGPCQPPSAPAPAPAPPPPVAQLAPPPKQNAWHQPPETRRISPPAAPPAQAPQPVPPPPVAARTTPLFQPAVTPPRVSQITERNNSFDGGPPALVNTGGIFHPPGGGGGFSNFYHAPTPVATTTTSSSISSFDPVQHHSSSAAVAAPSNSKKNESDDGGNSNNSKSTLDFLLQNKDCLKVSPEEFCEWLHSEDIVTVSDLADALDDDDYFRSEMQAHGMKGFKKGALKKAIEVWAEAAAVASKHKSSTHHYEREERTSEQSSLPMPQPVQLNGPFFHTTTTPNRVVETNNGPLLFHTAPSSLLSSSRVIDAANTNNDHSSIRAVQQPVPQHHLKNNNNNNGLSLSSPSSVVTTDVPHELCCPISFVLMVNDPVVASDAYTYERSAIEHWFAQNNNHNGNNGGVIRSPVTGQALSNLELIPNNHVLAMAREYARRTTSGELFPGPPGGGGGAVGASY